MLFSSISFLYYFLPVVLVVYFVVPKGLKNLVLLLASLLFYFYGEPVYVLLMIFSSVSGYWHGLWIERMRGKRYGSVALVSSITMHLLLLMYFKYTDFFIANVNTLFSSNFALLRVLLPIGISFYTFQILSYTIDVYRGEVSVQRNFINFATYVTLFPQLIAGPIVRYATVEKELTERSSSFSDVAWGIRRFVLGLAKKVILANTLGELGQVVLVQPTVAFYWLGAVAFMLQIYYDFSGYSDMAIGLGRIFGFHFLENFNYPYISRSIAEFWRRWHISLGVWFREYVYIPMGGNRVAIFYWVRNILVVWLLTGFWHGAEWNFIVWGLFFGVLLVLEKRVLGRFLSGVAGNIYVLLAVLVSFVIFNAGLTEGFTQLQGMFGFLGLPLGSFETWVYFRGYALVLAVAMVGATPLPARLAAWLGEKRPGLVNMLEPLLLLGLMLVITGYLVDGSFNPFLYFRF